ncbi:EVE domain-containing protein [Umezawaea beigongshangensis]|uniref:EVE domain-containing protein n=1 Tax=Umezawaea beigongshangensis TaxID=2780383 RepID=UPI0018F127E7|nr:EVE domain-containing protein [Umezawaea beigongshangensis]
MNDRQLVLQPRGGPAHNGPVNFERSVRRGVRLAEHADALGEDLAALEALYPDGVARLWGSTPSDSPGHAKAVALRDRRVGDRVLFYADKAFIAEATVVHLFRNAAAARSVWGTDADGQTWEHVMALGEVREFDSPVPAARVLDAVGMRVPLRSLTLIPAAKHALLPDLDTITDASEPRHWVLQLNPRKWDVWTWWERLEEPAGSLTVSKRLGEVRPGDRVALWISGEAAGVYALGTITSTPYEATAFDEHWIDPPERGHVVDVRFDRFLFDDPLTKRALVADPVFAGALIVRMPRNANPILLTPQQWAVLQQTAGSRGATAPPAPSDTVVIARPVGSVPERTTANIASGPREVTFPEARLVRSYQDFLGRELQCLEARLPSGERLVCDLFDTQTNTLIEAKASNTRPDVRMALGQLLDYRHHIKPGAALAVLLPAAPSPSIARVLHAQGVSIIHRDGGTFREFPPPRGAPGTS